MHARSALFDVYGDHLRTRGHVAPVAALVRLLEPVGITAAAVRTAISRMVMQGWLEPVALPAGRGYAATAQAVRRLDEARERIYRTRLRQWDGRWHLLMPDPVRDRSARSRLRDALGWLGYGELDHGLWVSPWPREGLATVLAREGVSATTAVACDFDPPSSPLAGWDLAGLGAEYAEWLAQVRALEPPENGGDPDRAAFAHRFHLVHEWRMFLFRDPELPDALLPGDWPGREAAAHFTAEAARLKPAADRFVDRCLTDS